ncbi:YpjP family protein [Alkalihalophilus pseudofirmus]|uniref:YpjP family protein n=1 Tax=Alkalihalophilus pseudofirmus TaxID=79885 RepID=UPI00259BC9A1|nr:YpjP family protein [Alkalihalophilus pseudofirmus]WEG18419.1 YpjP family protein [Alkalihalophilus pseudofirmus]
MMPWMKRGLVISSALLTLGIFVPPNEYIKEVQAQAPAKSIGESSEKPLVYKVNETSYELYHDVLPLSTDHYIHRDSSSQEVFTEYVMNYMYDQSMMKFGSAIAGKIEEPFKQEILPKLKDILIDTTSDLTKEEWEQVTLSKHPAAGLGEKIVHLYNQESGEDLLRFHVRRDHPPKQGYLFNFHYHTYLDQFEKHHDLGSIYWGKDSPPQWMSVNRV